MDFMMLNFTCLPQAVYSLDNNFDFIAFYRALSLSISIALPVLFRSPLFYT